MGDIHTTARSWFLAKIANGGIPQRVVGGEYDGLQYFACEIGGVVYWVTEEGLMKAEGEDVR